MAASASAIPTYTLPNTNIVYHYIEEMPLRVSALRSLGGYMNVFAIESFMDELAFAAKTDPVAFRLKHLPDQRSRDVVQLAAQNLAGRTPKPCRLAAALALWCTKPSRPIAPLPSKSR